MNERSENELSPDQWSTLRDIKRTYTRAMILLDQLMYDIWRKDREIEGSSSTICDRELFSICRK